MADRTGEIIRPSTIDDVPLLNALFREAFNHERPEEIWKWKYFRNPRGAATYLCEAEGRAVAHCAATPVRFRHHGEEFLAFQLVDFMSSASYAGGLGAGGVFIRTVRKFFGDRCGVGKVPLAYGFPGERHRVLGERLLGYRPIEPIVELSLRPSGAREVEIEPVSPAVMRALTDLPISMGAVRDETFLRWRYLEHPIHRYGAVATRGLLGRVKTAALVRETDDGILMMEVGGKLDRKSVRELVTRLRGLGAVIKAWMPPSHPIGRLFAEEGFEPAPRDHSLEIRLFFERPTPEPGEMYYTLGDYDVF